MGRGWETDAVCRPTREIVTHPDSLTETGNLTLVSVTHNEGPISKIITVRF